MAQWTFSTRHLLVAVAVAAMIFGTFTEVKRRFRLRENAIERIERAGDAVVGYRDGGRFYEYVYAIPLGGQVIDEFLLAEIARLNDAISVSLQNSSISDADLIVLEHF